MKRMIMSFAAIAGLLFGNTAFAQSEKGGQQASTELSRPNNTTPGSTVLPATRETRAASAQTVSTAPAAAANLDTTKRPKRDTMRSPQPVPPVPPVPMPPDTSRKK